MAEQEKHFDIKNVIILILAIVSVVSLWIAITAKRGSNEESKETESTENNIEESEKPVEKLTNTIALPQFAALTMKADTLEQDLTFINPAENFAFIRVSLLLDDAILWQSGLLEPGLESERVTLIRPLSAGQYTNAILRYNCYDPNDLQRELNGAASPITLNVQ